MRFILNHFSERPTTTFKVFFRFGLENLEFGDAKDGNLDKKTSKFKTKFFSIKLHIIYQNVCLDVLITNLKTVCCYDPSFKSY